MTVWDAGRNYQRDDAEYERARDGGALVVQGGARRGTTLREAGSERAGTVVTAIDDSNANVQVAILASQVAPTVNSSSEWATRCTNRWRDGRAQTRSLVAVCRDVSLDR